MDDFNFYNSENDGYRGGFGDYSDPIPTSGSPVQPGQAPNKKGGSGKRIAALILACAIVGGGAGVGGAALYGHFNGFGSTTIYEAVDHPQVQTVVNSNSGKAMTPEQLYAANLGSCVGITVSTTTVNIFGQATTSAASGSGFVLTQDGYIVTNYHVIEEAANDSSVSVEVAFENGDKYTAKLVGGEKDNDVAVLKIDATGLTPVTLGDSDKLVVGQSVYAIGNPLGELTFSMSEGIASSVNRAINVDGTPFNMIQVTASINPGNSGGPLLNSYGEVIGIVSAKYSSYASESVEGLGFAIPINDVVAMIEDIMTNGYVTNKPYLAITGGTMTSQMAAQYRYDVDSGVFVYSVEEGGAADKAGLKMGDVIIKVDDTDITSMEDLTAVKKQYSAGDTATFTIYREGQETTVEVTWDSVPADQQTNQQEASSSSDQNSQYDGSYNPFEDFFRYFYGGGYSGSSAHEAA